MEAVRRITYPYTIYALILEIVSLCGINFVLLITFINKIKKQKNKNIFRKIVFVSGFIIAFFIGKYLEGIESYSTEYIPQGMWITYRRINLSSIINPFIIFLILLDIVILVVKIRKKTGEEVKNK